MGLVPVCSNQIQPCVYEGQFTATFRFVLCMVFCSNVHCLCINVCGFDYSCLFLSKCLQLIYLSCCFNTFELTKKRSCNAMQQTAELKYSYVVDTKPLFVSEIRCSVLTRCTRKQKCPLQLSRIWQLSCIYNRFICSVQYVELQTYDGFNKKLFNLLRYTRYARSMQSRLTYMIVCKYTFTRKDWCQVCDLT